MAAAMRLLRRCCTSSLSANGLSTGCFRAIQHHQQRAVSCGAASLGDRLADVDTPALLVDLDGEWAMHGFVLNATHQQLLAFELHGGATSELPAVSS